ncbi:hypothetical protein MMC25_005657 [Agyrium rufum]|nr:hypothetical protein [Agyrium rufum]
MAMRKRGPDAEEDKPRGSDDEVVPAVIERFSPEEEASLLAEAHAQKSSANSLFTGGHFSEAIGTYDKALASCPNYLEYEIAVLQSNIAACHLKLEDWKAAVDAATKSLDALRREVEGPGKPKKEGNGEDAGTEDSQGETKDVEAKEDEVVDLGDTEDPAAALEALKARDKHRADIERIKIKALLRRAKARTEQGGWGNLAGAEEDYKALAKLGDAVPAQDRRVTQQALAELPGRINAAKEKEMGEMMGKLKDLGNGILRPFGLSTDMFKMNKDPATGGYNMSFEQGGGKKA